MANGTIAFDTLQTSGQITGTAKSVDTDYVVNGSAKAWYIFDQVNSNILDNNLNITDVTDRDSGSMYGNFTNNMSSVHYTVTSACSPNASGSMAATDKNRSSISSADTTARTSQNVYNGTSLAMADEENQQAVAHGDLA